ncbi:MAG: hypothetical protein ACPG7F_16805 [Aggregatilineales bacterium]
MRIYTVAPEVEVNGQSMLAFINNVQQHDIQPLLEAHNLTEVDADVWYPLQNWLDVLNDLNKRSNTTFNFVAVGLGIAKYTFLPPEVEKMPFADVMANINGIYQGNHRGGYSGEIQYEKVNDTHIIFTLIDCVYPDDLEYGVAYGFAKRLLPLGKPFEVTYDENVERLDRGGDLTVIHVKW